MRSSVGRKTAFASTFGAKGLSSLAGVDASFDSIFAVSASRNDRKGSSGAKGAKSTLAFAIVGGQLGSKVVLASQTTVSEAANSVIEKRIVKQAFHLF